MYSYFLTYWYGALTMSERHDYPTGVPCWVEGLHRDVPAALDFYGSLFGWEFEGSGSEPEYFVARLRGHDVAGIASMPGQVTHVDAMWMTHVRVDHVAAAAELAADVGGAVLAGPMEVPPAGSLAVLADPAGAPLCAWNPGERPGAALVNEPGAWAMSTLLTPDPDAAADFYASVFGWEVESFGPPEAGVGVFRRPGYVGGEPEQPVPRDVVAAMAPLRDGDPRWSVDFWVADLDASLPRVGELGGRVLGEPRDMPPLRRATVSDPQGGEFTLSQLVI